MELVAFCRAVNSKLGSILQSGAKRRKMMGVHEDLGCIWSVMCIWMCTFLGVVLGCYLGTIAVKVY